jgi:hypothetical protein
MVMVIRHWNGRLEEAILLSARRNVIRTAIRNREDVAEFRCTGGQWFAEGDQPVEIDFEAGSELDRFLEELALRGLDPGHSFRPCWTGPAGLPN